METTRALAAGTAGAFALNALHESARRVVPNAPRVELMAMKAIQRFFLSPFNVHMPERRLYWATLAGDLISNSLFYAFVVGSGKSRRSVWSRAALFGLGAGALAVVSPPAAGLGQQPTRNMKATGAMTIAWYVAGALVAAALFNGRRREAADPSMPEYAFV